MGKSVNKLRLTVLALFVALAAGSCDLIQSAQSTKVLAGMVLHVPPYDLADIPIPDAGIPFSFDGGMTTPEQTLVEVFFGERSNTSFTDPPKGLAGAAVKLSFQGATVDLSDKGGGNYSVSTAENGNLQYAPDIDYTLTVVSGGETFTARVKAPEPEEIAQLDERFWPLDVESNLDPDQNLELTRTSTENIAFTTVTPISATSQDPSYTDVPTEPRDLLDLVANDARWKQQPINVPKSPAFDQPNTYYLINVIAVTKGSVSDNLFTASTFLAGTADLGVAVTH
jgi:hypothetical protein